MRWGIIAALLIIFGFATLALAADNAASASATVHFLDQGWSSEERQQFYYTTQGSQLIPYDWYLALEIPGTEERFASSAEYGAAAVHFATS